MMRVYGQMTFLTHSAALQAFYSTTTTITDIVIHNTGQSYIGLT